jgi:hypothetical protein
MKNQINILTRIFKLVFSTRPLIGILDLIRKLSMLAMFIWEFTIYHEHKIAYVIFTLTWILCHVIGVPFPNRRFFWNL